MWWYDNGYKGKSPQTKGVVFFFFTLFTGGGAGQTHVQKLCCKFLIIIMAFWQHNIDTKRLIFLNFVATDVYALFEKSVKKLQHTSLRLPQY